jgi:hypothetical protein
MNTIVARDQWFRKKNAETFADTIATIDWQNAFWLRDLIEEKGFLGEDKIGCGTNGFPALPEMVKYYHILPLISWQPLTEMMPFPLVTFTRF